MAPCLDKQTLTIPMTMKIYFDNFNAYSSNNLKMECKKNIFKNRHCSLRNNCTNYCFL